MPISERLGKTLEYLNLKSWSISQRENILDHILKRSRFLEKRPEDEILGVMTNGDAEKFVPLWTQIVVDDLKYKKKNHKNLQKAEKVR